jgi:hypothetical protein
MRHPIRWRERKAGLSVTIKTKNTAVIISHKVRSRFLTCVNTAGGP